MSAIAFGEVHHGLYAVQSDMLTVWMPGRGSRTTLLEQRDAATVAVGLLDQVVRECFLRRVDTSPAQTRMQAQVPASHATRPAGPIT